MTDAKLHYPSTELWELARMQHGIVTRQQLMARGLTPKAIAHRIKTGRLHLLRRGIYVVGRPDIDRHGRWLAAVLSCGPYALLSHRSAAVLWGLAKPSLEAEVEVVIPRTAVRRRHGIRVHRRADLGPQHRREVAGIPLTDPISTLVDLASCVVEWRVERAINEADRLDLVDPETLRAAVPALPPRPGMARLRHLLGLDALTDTGLERRFLGLVRAAGLPEPETQAWVNGYRVDFYWPTLGLVVETDGWRYHRTPGQQATDYRRDHAHTRDGLTTLRVAEAQVRHEPQQVKATLAAIASRLLDAR
ncbi:MAG TPA: type IV toxin-antitoxin system AbiEi family antitoxin domain-containing protein [Solirubrobacterales bacterium]